MCDPFLWIKFIQFNSIQFSDGGSRDPELKKHLLAAKRAASQLFPGGEQPKKKARKSRWSKESSKMILPGLPTVLPANMKEDEQKLYLSKCWSQGPMW